MNILTVLFYFITYVVIVAGTLLLAYYPLALIAEFRPKHPPVFDTPNPLVSVIVPAYNEEKVIANCVKSIESSEYKNIEIILVDDGSTDNTLQVMRRYENPPKVEVIAQQMAEKPLL
jgi:cellulose synthase/poly-beta-1,6-N-acetylglucosamine synthase-like glycosyltransferase